MIHFYFGKEKASSSSYKINKFWDLMYNMMIIANIYFKVAKTLDLKCSHHTRRNSNYVMG